MIRHRKLIFTDSGGRRGQTVYIECNMRDLLRDCERYKRKPLYMIHVYPKCGGKRLDKVGD